MMLLHFAAALTAALGAAPLEAELVDVQRIWDRGNHNAFTSLVRHDGAWFCAFREGEGHVSMDGGLRILRSEDGKQWESTALLTMPEKDVRDPKLCVTPKNELMIVSAAATETADGRKHQSYVWFSPDGIQWPEPAPVCDPDFWLWRATWHDGQAYGVAYGTDGQELTRLYRSSDGKQWETLVPELFSKAKNGKAYPNEATVRFMQDGTALCLLRRDGGTQTAQLGRAAAPCTEWQWVDLGHYLGGPDFIQIPNGHWIAAGRDIRSGAKTVVYDLDVETGTLTELVRLPSGGDTSYPGLAWHEGQLWVSYYSSHEGKTSIYVARVKIGK